MTPDIAELRAKAAYHRREAQAAYAEIARRTGVTTGPERSCIVTVNGVDVGVSDRQFEIMEILIRDEAADKITDRQEISDALFGGNRNAFRHVLVQLRRRLAVAGVTIETLGKSGIRLNTIKAAKQ